jgi:hypothetical protein
MKLPRLEMGSIQIKKDDEFDWDFKIGDCNVYSQTFTKDWFAALLIAIAPALTCIGFLIYALCTVNIYLIIIWFANCDHLWLSVPDIKNILKYISTKEAICA